MDHPAVEKTEKKQRPEHSEKSGEEPGAGCPQKISKKTDPADRKSDTAKNEYVF